MPKEHDVSIYMRFIYLHIVIPLPHVWEFIINYGEEFAVHDTHAGKMFQPVETYRDHPNGWHIEVKIWENDEERFYQFLAKFCDRHELKFRDPRNQDED